MWATDEVQYVDLGDQRLTRRLARMVYDFAMQPMASVPQACGDWAATKAAYRFWQSAKVTASAILAGQFQRTVDRVSEHSTVLVIQDTTDLDFTSHKAMSGRGPLTFQAYQGLRVHSGLAVSLDGVPLGLVHQEVWARPPGVVTVPRRKRPTHEKESQRWLTTVEATAKIMPDTTRVITVADREADIFDLFALERPEHVHLLIRAAYNRRVTEETGHLWETLEAQPVQGHYQFTVGRRGDQGPREAQFQVRFAAVTVRAPNQGARPEPPPVPMWAILVEEVDPPEGVEPIVWRLLTSLAITSLDEAIQAVRWYSYRWLIERYHFVLKSGCRIEALQLETAAQIEKALATYAIVAWRLLWLLHHSRAAPDAPATDVLQEAEWQALYATIHRTTQLPPTPPTLSQAVRWIAQLGGFLARRRDGQPGVKTLWLGLRRLHDITDTWCLFHHPPAPSPRCG